MLLNQQNGIFTFFFISSLEPIGQYPTQQVVRCKFFYLSSIDHSVSECVSQSWCFVSATTFQPLQRFFSKLCSYFRHTVQMCMLPENFDYFTLFHFFSRGVGAISDLQNFQKCLLYIEYRYEQFGSTTFLKPLYGISKKNCICDTLCRCAYYQEIAIPVFFW